MWIKLLKNKIELIHIVSVAMVCLAVTYAAGAQNSCSQSVSQSGVQMNNREVRVAYPYTKSIANFNPHNIQTAADANLARNLYSRLIEFDRDGNIEPSLASDVYVEDGTIVLSIRKGVKSVDGQIIGAEDVLDNLKSIVLLDKNTHGSLRGLLGKNIDGKLDEYIWREDGKIFIRPETAGNTEFIVPLLASTDFSIVPIKDKNNLNISTIRNTSGVYYIKEDSEAGGFLLAANPNHYYYSKKIPQLIRFVPVFGKEALERFESGDIDFVVTISGGDPKHYQRLGKSMEDAVVKSTEGIQLSVIKTTESGREKHSERERVFIGQKIRQALLREKGALDGAIETSQIFPNLGEGTLTEAQATDLNSKIKDILEENLVPKNKFTLAVGPHDVERVSTMLEHLTFIKVVGSKAPPWVLPKDKQPDGYIGQTDSSFYESLSLLSYNFSTGGFGSKEEGDQWIQSYISIVEKNERIEKLRELHYHLLTKGYVTPVKFSSYMTISKKPLDFNISKFYAGTKLWEIEIK